MSLFPSLKSAEVRNLRSKLTDAESRADLAEHEATVLRERVAELNRNLSETRSELTAARETRTKFDAQQISIEASRMLASQGVPPVELEADSNLGGLWAQYQSIKDPGARRDFWNTNKDRLLAAKK